MNRVSGIQIVGIDQGAAFDAAGHLDKGGSYRVRIHHPRQARPRVNVGSRFYLRCDKRYIARGDLQTKSTDKMPQIFAVCPRRFRLEA